MRDECCLRGREQEGVSVSHLVPVHMCVLNKKRSDRAKADAGAVDTRRPQVYSTHAQRESPSYRELQRNAERERERRRGKEREREKKM